MEGVRHVCAEKPERPLIPNTPRSDEGLSVEDNVAKAREHNAFARGDEGVHSGAAEIPDQTVFERTRGRLLGEQGELVEVERAAQASCLGFLGSLVLGGPAAIQHVLQELAGNGRLVVGRAVVRPPFKAAWLRAGGDGQQCQ